LTDSLIQYVLHFPRGEKYVSLLKDAPVDAPEAQAHVIAERQRLRLLVKQQLSESATVTEADEGIKSTGQVRGICNVGGMSWGLQTTSLGSRDMVYPVLGPILGNLLCVYLL
jgi:hypothetical protein